MTHKQLFWSEMKKTFLNFVCAVNISSLNNFFVFFYIKSRIIYFIISNKSQNMAFSAN